MHILGRDTHRGSTGLQPQLLLSLLLPVLLLASACRDESVGIGDTDAALPDAARPDARVDERCAEWQTTPGELQVWNSTSGVGERHAAGAVGHDGTVLVVWANDDGVWGRVRCASGAPLREGGLDTRLDDGSAVALAGADVEALADGRFVVTGGTTPTRRSAPYGSILWVCLRGSSCSSTWKKLNPCTSHHGWCNSPTEIWFSCGASDRAVAPSTASCGT